VEEDWKTVNILKGKFLMAVAVIFLCPQVPHANNF
jgi:hypothetical protein